jgi:hypothetical protein
VLALAHKLVPDVTYDRDELIWSLSRGRRELCDQAQQVSGIRRNLTAARQVTRENPLHWTLVEAIPIAVMCPEQLPAFYRNVAGLGERDAVATAKGLVLQALKTL